MPGCNSESPRLAVIAFGDVVEFASLESLRRDAPEALPARFVVTELIQDDVLLSAGKIMAGREPERLSMFGTMEPPVRKIDEEPWNVDRVLTAMQWFIGTADLIEIRAMLEQRATVTPLEYPTF